MHEPRIYRYVMKYDKGIAPCIEDDLITVGCCKPKIRSTARPGDWVVGCLPRPAPLGVVALAGVVARVLGWGDYERDYRGRLDAVYRPRPEGGFVKLRPNFHMRPGSFEKDTGAPVLVLGPAWYFGHRAAEALTLLPPALRHLAPAGQGHRVNGVVPSDPPALLAWLGSVAPPGVHGCPRDEPYLPVPMA